MLNTEQNKEQTEEIPHRMFTKACTWTLHEPTETSSHLISPRCFNDIHEIYVHAAPPPPKKILLVYN
jgi:hypothetical protein